jgi:hypothetical protein
VPEPRISSPALLALASALLAPCGCSRAPLPAQSERAQLANAAPPASDPAADRSTALGASTTSGVASSTPTRAAGVALVELFTSEGCSSCPPADAVLARLAARAQASALPIYALSFHVDYWNYLGWRDRFSSARYSERQRGYAELNPSGGTYTPQVVVNGAAECVGSRAAELDGLIEAALKQPTRTQITLDGRRSSPSALELRYQVRGATAGRVLNLALLEPRAESRVQSGENAGSRLAHVNVVRAFEVRALGASAAGTWSIELPSDFDSRKVAFVAFAEDRAQRDVSGAASLELD